MHPEARALVDLLELLPHPEGGFYRETFRSSERVDRGEGRGTRAASTAIYYLLPAGTFSAWHRVASDEVWHFYDGDPVELSTLDRDGRLEITVLGRGWSAAQRPQVVVPAGLLQAARPTGPRFSLCGCTVAPGFDFADFEMPACADLVARYPAHRAAIEAMTRPKR